MEKMYEILHETPTLDEYKYLCSVAGLEENINFDVAEISLKNSVYSVIAKDDDLIIGMGRIVGDGAISLY